MCDVCGLDVCWECACVACACVSCVCKTVLKLPSCEVSEISPRVLGTGEQNVIHSNNFATEIPLI